MKKKDLLFTITGVLYANNESGSDPHILQDGMLFRIALLLLLLFAKCLRTSYFSSSSSSSSSLTNSDR